MDDLVHGPARGLVWDIEAAENTLGFFPNVLRLSQKFNGRPFLLDPSQKFIVGSLFGWRWIGPDGKPAHRRFRRAYIEQGKGNGKSPMAAGIGMKMLVADKEHAAEVYAGASMKSQAMVLFRDAVAMRLQSPKLEQLLVTSGVNPVWSLADMATSSFFRPISSDEAHSGPRPSCALLDEIHEHRDGNMIEMMERGFKSRQQPLLFMITNSGSNRQSVCWAEHQHALRVAAGTMDLDEKQTYVGEVIDDTTFSYVCCLDIDDDPMTDPSCWIKANPLLGITMPIEELERAVKQAQTIPGKLNNILRLHFCVWTESDVAWMARDTLETVLADFDPEVDHAGEEVCASVDLSATQDFTCRAFCVKTGTKPVEQEDGTVLEMPTYDAWVDTWTPAGTLAARALRDNAPYELWANQGYLLTTPGKIVNYNYIAARLAEDQMTYAIRVLAFDTYGFRKHFEPALDEAGVTIPIVEHPQGGKRKGEDPNKTNPQPGVGKSPGGGLWMPGSKTLLETLILEERIRIRTSPLVISAFMGAAVEEDPYGNSWFSKRKATTRIDPLVAITMAVGAAASDDSAVHDLSRAILDRGGFA